MATAIDYRRLREDIGASEASLPDTEAGLIFTEAAESYSDAAPQIAYTRVIAIRRLLASSAKLVNYQQNQSSENASDVFKHLKELLTFWRSEVATAATAASGSSAARFGGVRIKPSRIKEYPDNA